MARLEIHDWHTDIYLEDEEVKQLCRPGAGADTCLFLLMGPDGFECSFYNQGPLRDLLQRARRGETGARREGCSEIGVAEAAIQSDRAEVVLLP